MVGVGEPDEDLIGNAAAAAHVGVETNTWSGYVSRGLAPAPYRREIVRGYARPVWRRSTLDGWERPGQGARTDLTRKADGDL